MNGVSNDNTKNKLEATLVLSSKKGNVADDDREGEKSHFDIDTRL